MGRKEANASSSWWRSRDREGKGEGEGILRDDRRNGYQGQGRIQRDGNRCQKDGQD